MDDTSYLCIVKYIFFILILFCIFEWFFYSGAMSAYVYILLCSDDTLYTGYTTDIPKRLETHNAGKWAKYTRGRLPVRLAYSERFDTESEARKREYAIKELSRKEKFALIKKGIV